MPSNLKHLSTIVLFVVALTGSILGAEKKKSKKPFVAPVGTHARFEAEVLKVFSATHEGAVFRAYSVKWKEQEVIVSDSLAKTDYKIGDTITVLGVSHPYPKDPTKPWLLAFIVVPEPRR